MRIERINNGIVLDHIKAGHGLQILKLFSSELLKSKIDYASYVDSPSMELKDIIKIENVNVNPETLTKLALISPYITISIIRNGSVKEKIKPEIPNVVEGILTCTNPKCITLKEPYLTSRFKVILSDQQKTKQQCLYCEHYSKIESL